MAKTMQQNTADLANILQIIQSLPIGGGGGSNTAYIYGTWKFKTEDLEYIEFNESVSFDIAGMSWTNLIMFEDEEFEEPILQCYNSEGDEDMTLWSNYSASEEFFQEIDFGTTPQQVSTTFFNWFTDHAELVHAFNMEVSDDEAEDFKANLIEEISEMLNLI